MKQVVQYMIKCIITLIIVVCYLSNAWSADGDLDPSFNPGGIFESATQGFAVTVASNGKFYATGNFIDVDSHATQGVVRFNADGSVDTTFSVSVTNTSSLTSYAPTALAIQDDNKLLIGGPFTHVNGVERFRLARLNVDGSLDTNFTPALSASSVSTIVLDSSQKILVGGSISSPLLGGIGIVRLNSINGSADDSFTIQAINSAVAGIVENPDNTLIIGGNFTMVDGQARSRLAKLSSGGDLTDFGPMGYNTSVESSSFANVNALVKDPSGMIVVAGKFDSVNGVTRNNIARIDANGVLDTGFTPSIVGTRATSLAVNSSEQIAVGIEQSSTPFVVLNDDGSFDTKFETGDIGTNVFGVAWQADNLMFKPLMTVFGEFENPDNSRKGSLVARRNPSGEVDGSFLPGSFIQGGFLNTVAEDKLGRILVGGLFKKIQTLDQPFIARLRLDGKIDLSFRVDLDGSVSKITVLKNGKIMIGGFFNTVNGEAKSRIARLNSNGSLDQSFTASASGAVKEFLEVGSGQLFVGGEFSSMNGQPRGSFAKLDANGNLINGFPDLDFKTESLSSNPSVKVIKLDANNNILVAGDFTKSNDNPRFRFARFDADGLLDGTLTPEFKGSGNTSVSVDEILIQAEDSKLVFVGSFSFVNGALQQHIARINPNSGTIDSFDPMVIRDVKSVLLQPDTKFIFGSQTDAAIGGETSGGVARTLADGSLDQSFDAFPDGVVIVDNRSVNDMIFTADGKVIIVGGFLNINNVFRPAIGKLETGLPPFRIIDDELCLPIVASNNNIAVICL